MVYESFLQTIKSSLTKKLGPEYALLLRQVPKNNGILLDGLCISRLGEKVAPTIYLNEYYGQYMEGVSLEEIQEQIITIYEEHSKAPTLDFSHLIEYEQLKDKIVFKLIHAESNKELLLHIPHILYLDMAIVFYILLDGDEEGQMTAMVHEEHQQLWDVTVSSLYETAVKNTPSLLPPSLKNIQEVMTEIAKTNLGEDYKEEFMDFLLPPEEYEMPLYVLSNTKGLNGACCILYDGVIKNFADTVDSDIIILPSSIHEVLLIPFDDSLSFEELQEMVSNINRTEVPLEDRLSNQIYYYSRVSQDITVALKSSEPIAAADHPGAD